MPTAATQQILLPATPPASPTLLNVRLDEIAGLPLFDGVERSLVGRLAFHFTARQYRSGAILMAQGARVSQYLIISRGIVELIRIERGHQFGVLLLSARDIVMPAAVTFHEPTLVTVRTLTTTKTLEIDAALLRMVLEHSPRLSSNLMKAMSGQWRMSVRNILDLNCRTAAQRLGAFLLRLTDIQQEGAPSVLPIPKRHLAARLGITPETLSRNLQIVADHGLYLRGRAIVIQNRDAIERFCGPDPYEQPDERPLSVFAM